MKVSSLKYLIILTACGLTACSEWFVQNEPGRPTGYTSTRVVKSSTVSTMTNSPTTQSALDAHTPQAVASSGEAVGGAVGQSMDSLDRSKLSHALDNPLGKPTQWSNDSTGVRYTVVPVEKVTINGNSYCRRYTTTATKGGRVNQTSGVACVGANGNWEAV